MYKDLYISEPPVIWRGGEFTRGFVQFERTTKNPKPLPFDTGAGYPPFRDKEKQLPPQEALFLLLSVD